MSRLPHDTTKTFSEVFDNANGFLAEWKDSGLYNEALISDSSIKTLFYLLYAKFGNSAIANWDEEQFKYKVWANIFQYGPAWEKRLDIQMKLRNLTETELQTGAKAINDHSYAMGDDNITAGENPTKIDQKTGTYYTKSKLEAYTILWEAIKLDVTSEFLNKFKPLFATFVYTRPDIFISESEEGEEDE